MKLKKKNIENDFCVLVVITLIVLLVQCWFKLTKAYPIIIDVILMSTVISGILVLLIVAIILLIVEIKDRYFIEEKKR